MFDPDRVERRESGDGKPSASSFLAEFATQCMHAQPSLIPVDEILSRFIAGAPGFKSFHRATFSGNVSKLSALSFVPRTSTGDGGHEGSKDADLERYAGLTTVLVSRVLERNQALCRESLGHRIAPRIRLLGVQEGPELTRVVTLLELRNQRGVEEFLIGDLDHPARFQAAHGRVLTEVSHYFEKGNLRTPPSEVVRPHMFPQEFRDQVNRYVWHRDYIKDGVAPKCLPGEMCFVDFLVRRALLLAKVDAQYLSQPLPFVKRMVDEPTQQVLACGFSPHEVWGVKLHLDENWVPSAIRIGANEG